MTIAPQAAAYYDGEHFAAFRSAVAGYESAVSLDHDYWSDVEPCSILIDEVEALWSAIDQRDDWGPLHAKVEATRRMGEASRAEPRSQETNIAAPHSIFR